MSDWPLRRSPLQELSVADRNFKGPFNTLGRVRYRSKRGHRGSRCQAGVRRRPQTKMPAQLYKGRLPVRIPSRSEQRLRVAPHLVTRDERIHSLAQRSRSRENRVEQNKREHQRDQREIQLPQIESAEPDLADFIIGPSLSPRARCRASRTGRPSQIHPHRPRTNQRGWG